MFDGECNIIVGDCACAWMWVKNAMWVNYITYIIIIYLYIPLCVFAVDKKELQQW